MRILLTGGGTGGHIYPALTVAEEIRRLDPTTEFLYVGTAHGLEADLVPRAGFPLATVQAGGLVRTGALGLVTGALRMAAGVMQAIGVVRRFRPDAVLATGGYVSGPVLLAARLLGRPMLLWEGNAVPGATIRLFSRRARAVFVPYAEARAHFPPAAPLVLVSNPVRGAFLAADRDQARAELGLRPGDELLLVSGGSRGALGIMRAVVGAFPRLVAGRPGLRVLHATGANLYDQAAAAYRAAGVEPDKHPNLILRPYLYDMPGAMAAADLAISRAGAGSCTELAVRGLPAILVPFPYATHGHQEFNARALERRGGAVVLLEPDLTPESLAGQVLALLESPPRRREMARALREAVQPDGAVTVARRVLAVAGGRE